MIIRSQDKKNIVNFNNIKNIKVQGWESIFDICVAEYNFFEKIGTYSTEEKAIKVLDMIQQEYGRHIYGKGGAMATADYYVPPFAFIPPKVFQMPEDEDVEV